ncbi:hypothetical protein EDD92_6951 [Streptomyces sp. TLI_185]|nr:hypothetical protein EDD92_6951 [Streptomyces sp. TLI_185]
MTDISGLEPVATFCGNCEGGCPQGTPGSCEL